MKLIHCADLHLDSKMTANLDSDKAKERKEELLFTFQRMVSYAVKEGVCGILIAGDLFDTKNILKTTKNVVLNEMISHPGITFYYLKGNHDTDNFLSDLEEIPENLKLFSEEWTSYEVGELIRIWGAEFTKENGRMLYPALVPDREKINIVMLHGQESETGSKDKAEIINLRGLENKGIDYLALGHIHAFKEAPLDGRGIYCYPGCLEGRGFDECGKHGFVLLDIDEAAKKIHREFVPFATRILYTVLVDVTGCDTSAQMTERAKEELKRVGCRRNDLVKIDLTGEVNVECEKNPEYIKKSFENDFYFVKVYDHTKLSVDIEAFALDISLKGEFVRTVKGASGLSEEDKNTIIRYGLQILEGNQEVEE